MPVSFMHDLAPSQAGAATAHHAVLPFAACASDLWWPTVQALPAQATTHLRALLRDMRVIASDQGPLHSLTPPHERLLARQAGLPVDDGRVPWAAWQRAQDAGSPPTGAWAFVTLCHWAMGREHATLSDPQALDIDAEESQALLQAMQPFFESDGLRLHAWTPSRWLVEGAAVDVPTASLDRVMGRNVDPWLPSAQEARLVRRLQNEMQMLLYTHPVNEARQQQRRLAINSIWFSGSGTLRGPAAPAALHLPRALAQAALAEDWPAYAQAWAEVDATVIEPLLTQQQAGQVVQLSLCGERGSLTLQTAPRGWAARVQQLIRRPAWPSLLQGL